MSPNEIETVKDGLLVLEVWCAAQTPAIRPSNARGYYIPQQRIPGARKIGGIWWVPATSRLLPAQSAS